jgi:hypothetical protein
MKFVQNIFDQTRPLVEKDGKRNILYPLHNALETMAFVPDHTAHSGAHVRDAIDLKAHHGDSNFCYGSCTPFWNVEHRPFALRCDRYGQHIIR